MFKRFIVYFSLVMAGIGLLAVFEPGSKTPYWVAVGALSLAGLAIGGAVASHFRLSRVLKEHQRLSEKLDAAVYRLEKRNDIAQTRLTQLSQGQLASAPSKNAVTGDSGHTLLTRSAPVSAYRKPLSKSSIAPRLPRAEGWTVEGIVGGVDRRHPANSQARDELGPLVLRLMTIQRTSDSTSVAHIALGRLGDRDYQADEHLPIAIDRAAFCERLLRLALRSLANDESSHSATTPIICGLTAEFLADFTKVEWLAETISQSSVVANALILCVSAKMTGSVSLQRQALDRLASAGVRFAISGDRSTLAIRKPRGKMRVAYILTRATEYGDEASQQVFETIVMKAVFETADVVALDAVSTGMQDTLVRHGAKYLTSGKTVPVRKSDVAAMDAQPGELAPVAM